MSRLTILSVAEKPSVAKSLAEIIGRGQFTSRNGISPFNKVFEVEGDFRGQRCKMIITSVLGHMMNMEIDEAYSSWAGTNPLGLFDCKVYKTFNKAGEQLKATLEREIRNCDGLMLWLDCDLEGENIAFEVLNCCEKANPRIAGKVYRAKFSALNERDIFHTLNNPGIPNRHMNDAVDARQEIDLRLGAAFTRFQTLRLQSKFPQALNGHTLVSYGPCQFPTLGFVVDQYIKIQQFIPENFWRLTMEIETIDVDADPSGMKKKKKYPFEWERGRLYDHLSCFLIFEECCTADYAVVMECNSKPTTKMRPCPLNTVELQMEASRKLHITSDHTMDIAEKLYQAGHISYPRTETTVYKEGSNLIELITAQVNDGMWGGYAASLLDQQLFEWPRDGGQNDQAHPPIHPLKALTNSDPGSDEFKIYELITRHFLACCSRDAKGQQSTVKVEVSTAVQGELFKATGLMVLERNWLDVYKYTKWTGNTIPTLREGDSVPFMLDMVQSRTEPPPLLTEGDLISIMDKSKIGTDATIATHIKTIQDRQYVTLDNRSQFSPTKLGLALYEGYEDMGYKLMKPYLRCDMERDVGRIARGELSKDVAIKACLDSMKDVFIKCVRDAAKLDDAMTKYFQDGLDDNGAARLVVRGLSSCGVCRRQMDLMERVSRTNADEIRNMFLLCGTCNFRLPVPSKGNIAPNDAMCGICQFQALSITNTETLKSHTICPKCFKSPPGPPHSEEGILEFRCFQCAHPTCTLAGRTAGGDVALAPCPICRTGELRMNKRAGKFMFGCSQSACKYTWWLPKYIFQVQLDPGLICVSCSAKAKASVLKVALSVTLAQAPLCSLADMLICPSCDSFWRMADVDPLKTVQSIASLATAPMFNANNNTAASNYSAAATGEGRGKPGRHQSGAGLRNNNNTGHYHDGHSSNIEPRSNLHKEPTRREKVEVGYANDILPDCNCGIPSASRVVSKEGPNKGRQFYTCSKRQPDQCGYFLFADQQLPPAAEGRARVGPGQKVRVGPHNGAVADNNVICGHCKQPGHWARACPMK